jgi:putative transposase
MSMSLNTLYTALLVSKQSFHQQMNRALKQQSEAHLLLTLIYQIRHDHPTMGSRDMYYKLQPQGIGRDAFERLCKQYKLTSKKFRNYRRTTDSQGVIRFSNLVIGLKIMKLNQVWVSDITYFDVGGKFYYLTFILDAYSRRIIGHNVSNNLSSINKTTEFGY